MDPTTVRQRSKKNIWTYTYELFKFSLKSDLRIAASKDTCKSCIKEVLFFQLTIAIYMEPMQLPSWRSILACKDSMVLDKENRDSWYTFVWMMEWAALSSVHGIREKGDSRNKFVAKNRDWKKSYKVHMHHTRIHKLWVQDVLFISGLQPIRYLSLSAISRTKR